MGYASIETLHPNLLTAVEGNQAFNANESCGMSNSLECCMQPRSNLPHVVQDVPMPLYHEDCYPESGQVGSDVKYIAKFWASDMCLPKLGKRLYYHTLVHTHN